MLNINLIKNRKEPIKQIKFKENENKCNVVSSKKEKLYEYYICDYCNSEIRLDKKKHERSGGIAIIPHTLTKCGQLKLALCNKCIKEIQKYFEENNK